MGLELANGEIEEEDPRVLLVEIQAKEESPEVKHSLFVARDTKDKFFVSIRGTNNRHEVEQLIHAVQKEVSARKRRAIPLSNKSA